MPISVECTYAVQQLRKKLTPEQQQEHFRQRHQQLEQRTVKRQQELQQQIQNLQQQTTTKEEAPQTRPKSATPAKKPADPVTRYKQLQEKLLELGLSHTGTLEELQTRYDRFKNRVKPLSERKDITI